jgi:hypothetical protein
MRNDGQTLGGNEMVIPHVDLDSVKGRAKKTFTRERFVDVVISASTVTVVGTVLSVLHRAVKNQTIVGF